MALFRSRHSRVYHQACGGTLRKIPTWSVMRQEQTCLFNHIVQGVVNLFPVLYGYLLPGMLDWGDESVSPDGIGSRHVAYGVKGAREDSLQGNNVLEHFC